MHRRKRRRTREQIYTLKKDVYEQKLRSRRISIHAFIHRQRNEFI